MALGYIAEDLIRNLNRIVTGERVVLVERDDVGTTRFSVVDKAR
jgi:hypothetical protein